mmetsp:Transcript_28311/g.48083  ORF Transcript_28311/g.48083 Transcript_28311/m.48083 type:complete len:255 (-) Transcript_28311:555-1319(-)
MERHRVPDVHHDEDDQEVQDLALGLRERPHQHTEGLHLVQVLEQLDEAKQAVDGGQPVAQGVGEADAAEVEVLVPDVEVEARQSDPHAQSTVEGPDEERLVADVHIIPRVLEVPAPAMVRVRDLVQARRAVRESELVEDAAAFAARARVVQPLVDDLLHLTDGALLWRRDPIRPELPHFIDQVQPNRQDQDALGDEHHHIPGDVPLVQLQGRDAVRRDRLPGGKELDLALARGQHADVGVVEGPVDEHRAGFVV